MRRRTNRSGEGLRNTMATGLAPLLFLTILSGCTARHLPEWSTVLAVKPGTKTGVQLYEDEALLGHGEKIKGRFLSATDDSVTLELSERIHTDLRIRTFQKSDVRKVLRHRPFWKRKPAWATLLALLTAHTVIEMLTNYDEAPTRMEKYGGLLTVTLPITATVFYGSRMEGVYEVPPKHRGSHRPPGPAAIKTNEPNDSE